MKANYLKTLDTTLIITKDDIILALTEAEVSGWKKTQKKLELMDILLNAIEEAEATEEARKEGTTMEGTTRTIATEEARIKKEAVATLRKWAKARNMKDADKMKKAELVKALAEDNIKAIEATAKQTTRKEGKTMNKKTADKKASKKDNKKEASAQKADKKAEAKAKEVMTTLKAERGRIAIAIDAQNTQNVEIADALNRIKTLKLYEEASADNMKDYINNKCNGKLYGMTYSTVNMYINAMNYVYSLKLEDGTTMFATYGMHLIQALVVPCRYHSADVVKAVKECRVRSTMSLASLKEVIKAEGWTSPKAQKEGKEGSTAEAEAEADSTEAEGKTAQKDKSVKVDNAILTVNKAVKIVLNYYNKNKDTDKAEELAKAWDAIKEALD